MRRLLLAAAAVTCLLVPLPAMLADDAKPTLGSLAWMAGAWKGDTRTGSIEETWMPPAAGTMLATCRILGGGKVVMREFMLLEELPDGLFLTLRHVGEKMADREQAPLLFHLESLKGQEATFATAGEKPVRLIYRREADGALYARVETYRNGEPAKLEFTMKRVRSD